MEELRILVHSWICLMEPLVICHHVDSLTPLTAFSSKKSDRLTRHQTPLVPTIVIIYHGIIIFLRGRTPSSSSSRKWSHLTSHPKETIILCVSVSVCWQRPDDRDFRSAAYSAKQNSENMLERATRFVDLCKWICGTRWEVDFWRARLQISLSAGFWQIIGCGFLGGAHKTQ